jgi:hypothetical protein
LDDKIGVITLTNADDIPVYPDVSGSVSSKIFDWIVPEIKKQVTSEQTSEEYDSSLMRYTGKYRDLYNDFEVTIMDGELFIIKPTSDNPLSSASKLKPIEKHVFKVIKGSGMDTPGELVTFEEDKNGNIVRMKTGGWIREKIEKW